VKKLLLETVAISLMLLTLAVPSVFAWDFGPVFVMDPVGGGDYGEYVLAGVGANIDSGMFVEAYWYAGRVLGSAQGFCGYLWFQFYYDASNYMEWYDSGTSYGGSCSVSTNTLRSRAWSGFYDSELYEWSWDTGLITITI